MHAVTVKTYKTIHTWTGIVSGLLLYICFIAGALTMFRTPLNQWVLQTDSSLPAISINQYDDLIQKVLTEKPEAAKNLLIQLPNEFSQAAPATWTVENEETHHITQFQASLDKEGQLITNSTPPPEFGNFIDNLHRTGGIPGTLGHDPLGTQIMGIIAGLYIIAIISGLITFLPTWFKDFLTLRKDKHAKRYWLDFHNVLGISSLPFHLIIAVTTFVFAFHDYMYGALGAWVYEDTPLFERPALIENPHPYNELMTVEQLDHAIKELEPEFRIAELLYTGLDSRAPNIRIGGYLENHPSRGLYHNYSMGNPYTGELSYTGMLPSQGDGYSKTVISLFSLHLGSFGGAPVRWLYFFLGLSGALIFLTGNILWVESRQKKQRKDQPIPEQKTSTVVMAKLTVGVATGTLLGIALALCTAKLLPHSSVEISYWQTAAFYCGFLLCIVWTFLRKSLLAAREQLLLIVAITAIAFIAGIKDILMTQSGNLTLTIGLAIFLALFTAIALRIQKKIKTVQASSVWLA